MNYRQTLEYIYNIIPNYQLHGKDAVHYKLDHTLLFCQKLGNPHNSFKSVHIAGTNGKGSVAHYLTSVCMESGLKAGLFTSPHLFDFRERIKVNGKTPNSEYVVNFVKEYKSLIEEIRPSFFELSFCMALDYFKKREVDIAIIETGMGGRLDATNIIHPELSIITSIGYDHAEFLGDTLEKIAFEKAGIIKPQVPVVTGNIAESPLNAIKDVSKKKNATLFNASENFEMNEHWEIRDSAGSSVLARLDNPIRVNYQKLNIPVVYQAFLCLKDEFELSEQHFRQGIANVITNTHLTGRWQLLQKNPRIICDTAHNEDGISLVSEQLREEKYENLYLVLGFLKDKDIKKMNALFPENAIKYYCGIHNKRGAGYQDLEKLFPNQLIFENVNTGIKEALINASDNDLIFIGGSNYLIAEMDMQKWEGRN